MTASARKPAPETPTSKFQLETDGMMYAMTCDRKLVNIANPTSSTTAEMANLVRRYRWFNLHLSSEVRELDKEAQEVDERIFSVPLHLFSGMRGFTESSSFLFYYSTFRTKGS